MVYREGGVNGSIFLSLSDSGDDTDTKAFLFWVQGLLYGASPEFCPSEQSFSLRQDCTYNRRVAMLISHWLISSKDLMERGPATID